MPDLKHIKEGDTLYDSGKRTDSRMNTSENRFFVKKVSRKYMTVSRIDSPFRDSDLLQINRETGKVKTDFNSFVMYESKEHYEDEVLSQDLVKRIVKCFGYWHNTAPENVTTKQLQKILDILEGKE